MSIFKKLGWFFKQEKKSYIIGVFSLMMVALVQLVPPKVIGVVVDEIVNKEIRLTKIIVWVALLIGAGLAQYLFRYIWRMHIWGSAARLEKELRTQLFHHFTKMDSIFYQKYRTGDLMAHATNDLNAIQNVAGAGILTFADSVITGGTTIIAMVLFVDWRLTLIALLPLPLLAVTSRVLGSKLHDAFRDSQAAFSAINDKTQESITGIKVIKTFGQEKEDLADFTEKIDDAIVKNKRTNFLDALFDPFITLIIGVSYVVTIIIGGRFIMQGTISLGQLVSFIAYIGMLVWPMFAIGRLFNVLERGNASYDRVNELLHEKTHIIEGKDAIKTMAQGTISMKIASFSYPKEETVALENIQFSLQEGETLGIVGKTGAGKTTILKLLMREYDQYQGTISFGKHNIKNYTLDALMGAMGYVPQDHFLFSVTVRDNIRFAKPDLEQAAVEQAAALAFINQEIKTFPEGYDTMVGERGVSLSGGQKQRISIARALIVEPELLILDDALSAVDAKTEEAILSNLKETRQEKTTIITAHRLSSVMHAKEILVLDQGKIIERGTHQELLTQNGWYQRMWEKQQLEAKIEGSES
ncbi:ABC transporter transmembrane domain-containing protein [Enterococcus faecalis]|uniref:ABC transporter ATP-binding protein n=1 Tax=Enterococcus faecalis TaxID=1351 RepID=UPI000DE9252F|nr:ABC transporter transmembrane domain-containing protein [Enterococcus faecalis]EGO8273702.1 ATP-binding cassette domain-containing protein [Enterococcus faecalis]EGO9000909.1 ATP-binding cassette domain-containing protein [Enterococcus faecalis]MDB1623162.1 ABC transporter transmembrane domain-containing protein [Enterococcus faecalis]NSW11225.1 ATP-binding cassette domain-containing protein [Enterococcus faecalis]RBR49638.1 ABC transporter ATP-binding protein/peptidase [Enterococcus faecal